MKLQKIKVLTVVLQITGIKLWSAAAASQEEQVVPRQVILREQLELVCHLL